MPRLFTGIEISSPLRSRLSMLQSGLPKVRWVEPADMHVTLRFFGDVSPKTATGLLEALRGRSWQAPELAVTQLDAFGGNKPKSIYAALAPFDELAALHMAQERLAQQLGFEAETRKFTPHITLSRGTGATVEQVAQYLSANGDFVWPAFRPTRFVLYSARESVGGGPYHVEESFPFTQA